MVVIDKQNMLVLIVENNKNPEEKVIPNRLNTLRRIIGNFIITGNDVKNQDFKDLTEEQIKTYKIEFELEQTQEQEQGEEMEDE